MVEIGDLKFDDTHYDADSDVLYLSVGPPRPAADTHTTPEGHAVRYDAKGQVIGVTLVSPRAKLALSGEMDITIGDKRLVAGRGGIDAALGAGARAGLDAPN